MTLRNMITDRETNASELITSRNGRFQARYNPYTRQSSLNTPTSGFSAINTFTDFVRQLSFTSTDTESTSTSPASPPPLHLDSDTEYESDDDVLRTPPRGTTAPPPSPSLNATPAILHASSRVRAIYSEDEDTMPFDRDMENVDRQPPQSPASAIRASSPSVFEAIFYEDTMPFDQEMVIADQQLPQLETPQSPTSENYPLHEPEEQPQELHTAGAIDMRIRVVPIESLMEPLAVNGSSQQQQLVNTVEQRADAEPQRQPLCPCCLEDLLQLRTVAFSCGHLLCDECLDRLFESKAREASAQPYDPIPRIKCPSCRKEVQFIHKIFF